MLPTTVSTPIRRMRKGCISRAQNPEPRAQRPVSPRGPGGFLGSGLSSPSSRVSLGPLHAVVARHRDRLRGAVDPEEGPRARDERVLLDDALVDLDAQPWPLRNLEDALADVERLLQDLVRQ